MLKRNSFSVKDTLGYSRNEMVGNWFGRYLASDDVDKLQAIRQKYCNERFLKNLVDRILCCSRT